MHVVFKYANNLPSMQMDKTGIPVQDRRVSKLLSNTVGRPAKTFDEKASKLAWRLAKIFDEKVSKFYGYESKPSEHIWDRIKRNRGDVTTHDVMKGNKTCIQQAYHIVAWCYVDDVSFAEFSCFMAEFDKLVTNSCSENRIIVK